MRAVSYSPTALSRVLDLTLAIDRNAEKAFVQSLRQRHPDLSREQLIDRLTRRARWWGAGVGFVTGVGSNPWAALPAALADVAAVLHVEVRLACRIALLFDPQYLDDPEPPYELLVPIFGARAASELAGRAVVQGGREVTQRLLSSLLAGGGVTQLRGLLLKHLGLRVTQRGVVTKLVPIAGGVIGGGWNYAEMTFVSRRVRRYFEGETIDV